MTPPSRIFAHRASVRPATVIFTRHLGLLLTAHLAGYLIGFGPLLVVTILKAQYGGPNPLVVLTGLLGLATATVTGYLIGVWTRSAVMASLSFVLFLGVTMIGTTDLSALAPVPSYVSTWRSSGRRSGCRTRRSARCWRRPSVPCCSARGSGSGIASPPRSSPPCRSSAER